MKYSSDIAGLRLLGILMFFAILAFTLLIWRDFSSGLYEGWGYSLAAALEDFENNLAGN